MCSATEPIAVITVHAVFFAISCRIVSAMLNAASSHDSFAPLLMIETKVSGAIKNPMLSGMLALTDRTIDFAAINASTVSSALAIVLTLTI